MNAQTLEARAQARAEAAARIYWTKTDREQRARDIASHVMINAVDSLLIYHAARRP